MPMYFNRFARFLLLHVCESNFIAHAQYHPTFPNISSCIHRMYDEESYDRLTSVTCDRTSFLALHSVARYNKNT